MQSVGPGGTLSGSFNSLARFTASGKFKDLGFKSIAIQIFASYHAPHLYSQDDVEEVVVSLALCAADGDGRHN